MSETTESIRISEPVWFLHKAGKEAIAQPEIRGTNYRFEGMADLIANTPPEFVVHELSWFPIPGVDMEMCDLLLNATFPEDWPEKQTYEHGAVPVVGGGTPICDVCDRRETCKDSTYKKPGQTAVEEPEIPNPKSFFPENYKNFWNLQGVIKHLEKDPAAAKTEWMGIAEGPTNQVPTRLGDNLWRQIIWNGSGKPGAVIYFNLYGDGSMEVVDVWPAPSLDDSDVHAFIREDLDKILGVK